MKIPVDKQLLIYIRYVKSQQTMQSITDLFGVCEATVYSLVRRISSVISTNADNKFPGNVHLLGDAAILDWLLTPFKDYGNLNDDQKHGHADCYRDPGNRRKD
ncbi:uncharacterized protein LOC127718674 [Mytilus californianus]|uniref:uncharacterized protein LOC127718674 n=1 Tax=Mytilus californianus TaxID=6549 RepID=UPI002247C41B|nr:uncharacterized protein LOC127718674 [Mytilus californianus]